MVSRSAQHLDWAGQKNDYLKNGLTFYLHGFYESLKENMIHFTEQQLGQEVIFIWLHFAAKDKMNLTLFLILFFPCIHFVCPTVLCQCQIAYMIFSITSVFLN